MRYKNKESVISILTHARISVKLSQLALAKKMKTKQSSISRTENGSSISIGFAEKWARACGYELRFNHVSIEKINGTSRSSLSFFTEPYEQK